MNITEYRENVRARAVEAEPIGRFAESLTAHGFEVPDRFDLADGLSPSEGEVLALFYNPQLRLARLDAGVALANYETAGLWQDPEFGFDGADILSPSGPFEYGLALSLTIPISGRLGVEKDRAEAAYEAELRRIVDAEWTTRARVRSAWAVWSASLSRLGLLRETIEQTEFIVAIADRLEAAGELTRVEVRLLRAALIEARSDVAQGDRDEVRSRIELLGLMGLAPDADIQLQPLLILPTVPQIEDPVQRLIEANTALAVLRAEYRVAEETLRLEVRKQYPDITIGSGYGSENNDDRLLLGVSMPIPILNANRAGIADARARREVSRAAAETTYEQLTRELANAQAEFEAAKIQRRYFEAELVPMYDEQMSEVDRLADLGEVDTFVLLESVTQAYAVKSRLLDLRVEEIAAATVLARLLGPADPMSPAPIDITTPEQGASGRGREATAEGDSE